MEESPFGPVSIDEQISSDDTYTDESLYDADLFLERLKDGSLCLMEPEYLFKDIKLWTSFDFKLWIEQSFIPEYCPEFTLQNIDDIVLENLLRNFNYDAFLQFDPVYGSLLYSVLKDFMENTSATNESQINSLSPEEEMTVENALESDTSKKHTRSKRPYRLTKPKNCFHVWEFCRDLLKETEKEPNELIEWVNSNEGIFRFKSPDSVAMLWGQKKKRKSGKPMTYENMYRGLRYSLQHGYFENIINRVTFKFSKKSIEKCKWLQSVVKNSFLC